MTIKDEKTILKAIFEIGIDGNNSNNYYIMNEYIKKTPVEAKKITFSLLSLQLVLEELSKRWDKEIDKIVE